MKRFQYTGMAMLVAAAIGGAAGAGQAGFSIVEGRVVMASGAAAGSSFSERGAVLMIGGADASGATFTVTQNAAFLIDACPYDVDGDGAVGAADLANVLTSWGQPGGADFNEDGTVDAYDLAALLGAWGPCD